VTLALLQEILSEQPKFHRGEVEVQRDFTPDETLLDPVLAKSVASREDVCWGVDDDVAKFIYEAVGPGSQTLETGAGISTLVFAMRGAKHVAITPNANEHEAIAAYARSKNIGMDGVTFVAQESEAYLPAATPDALDLVLIDGKHAFPWPVLDWFYTADRLKKGGLMIIDDVQVYSVRMLRDFMIEDPRWDLRRAFSYRTCAFEKVGEPVHDVAWHMQPYIWKRSGTRGRVRRLRAFVRGLLPF